MVSVDHALPTQNPDSGLHKIELRPSRPPPQDNNDSVSSVSSDRLIRSGVLSYNRDHTTREDNNKKRTAFDYYWLPGRAEQRPFDSVVLFDLVLRGARSLLRSQSKVMADVFGVERDYWVCAVHQHDRCWWREGEAGFLADLSTFPDAVLCFRAFQPW